MENVNAAGGTRTPGESAVRRRRERLFVFLVISGLLLYGIPAVSGAGIWSDEAFSLGMVRLGFREIWNLPDVDVHPPLYYYYLKLFLLVFGDSLISARIASAVPFLFILLFGGRQLGRLGGGGTGLLFMASFLAFPSLLPFAFEVRMYSLAAAFVFANGVFAYRCAALRGGADWFWLAICSAGAAYTHYYAALAAGLTDLALLAVLVWKRSGRMKYWAGSFGLMVLTYLPWCGHMFGQVKYKAEHEYWIREITLRTICSFVYQSFRVEGLHFCVLFLAAAYFILFVWSFRNKHGKTALILLLPVLVAGVGVAVSAIVRPVLVFRYLIPSLCVLPVFAALVLAPMFEAEKDRRLAAGVLSVILITGVINAVGWTVRENTEPENAFNRAWAERQDCDTYLVTASRTHASTVLAYFEEEKPIYASTIESGEANPFPNIFPLPEPFCPAGKEKLILITDKGKDPSEGVPEGYSCRWAEQIVEDDGCVYDIYELNPSGDHA